MGVPSGGVAVPVRHRLLLRVQFRISSAFLAGESGLRVFGDLERCVGAITGLGLVDMRMTMDHQSDVCATTKYTRNVNRQQRQAPHEGNLLDLQRHREDHRHQRRQEVREDVHDMPRDWTDLAERELFIPDTIYDPIDDTVIRRAEDPNLWEAAV